MLALLRRDERATGTTLVGRLLRSVSARRAREQGEIISIDPSYHVIHSSEESSDFNNAHTEGAGKSQRNNEGNTGILRREEHDSLQGNGSDGRGNDDVASDGDRSELYGCFSDTGIVEPGNRLGEVIAGRNMPPVSGNGFAQEQEANFVPIDQSCLLLLQGGGEGGRELFFVVRDIFLVPTFDGVIAILYCRQWRCRHGLHMYDFQQAFISICRDLACGR